MTEESRLEEESVLRAAIPDYGATKRFLFYNDNKEKIQNTIMGSESKLQSFSS
jgi:hypothetical protein